MFSHFNIFLFDNQLFLNTKKMFRLIETREYTKVITDLKISLTKLSHPRSQAESKS